MMTMQKKRPMEDAPPEANAVAKAIFRKQGRAFLQITKHSYASQGRGAIVVHTTSGTLNEITYIPAESVKILLEQLRMDVPDVMTLMQTYDPQKEFVIVCFDEVPTDDATDFCAGIVRDGKLELKQ